LRSRRRGNLPINEVIAMASTLFFVFASLGCLLFAAQLFAIAWVAADAQARDANPWLWGILAFFFLPIVLLLYLILRPAGPLAACPHCGRTKLAGLPQCPHCRQAEAISLPGEMRQPIQWAVPRLSAGILFALSGFAITTLATLGGFLISNVGSNPLSATILGGVLTLAALTGSALALFFARRHPRLDHAGLLLLAGLLVCGGLPLLGNVNGILPVFAGALLLVIPGILLLALVTAQVSTGIPELLIGLLIGVGACLVLRLPLVRAFNPSAFYPIAAFAFSLPFPLLAILRLIGKPGGKTVTRHA
jgi:hypothetical protein